MSNLFQSGKYSFAKRWYRYGKMVSYRHVTSSQVRLIIGRLWKMHVADAPSTLNVVFPEIYLGTIENQENDCNSSGAGVKNDKETGRKTKYASMTDDERIKYINTTMDTYLTDGNLKASGGRWLCAC